jgi:hypothetical protein
MTRQISGEEASISTPFSFSARTSILAELPNDAGVTSTTSTSYPVYRTCDQVTISGRSTGPAVPG